MGVLSGKKGFSLRSANPGTKSGGNRGNRWPEAKIPRSPVAPKRPDPAPGESWVERFCTVERLAEMASKKRGGK